VAAWSKPAVEGQGETQRVPDRASSGGYARGNRKEQEVDEQRTPGHEPTLRRPEESIEDLEPDERASEAVQGGGLNLPGVAGESMDAHLKRS
jgi:hypothetical protein